MEEKNTESSHPLMRHVSGNSDSSEANNDTSKGSTAIENNGIVIKRSEPGKPQGCCGVGWFVCNLSALLLLNMIMIVYNVSVVRTLEKRFSLKSTQTGLMWSMNDVTHISLVTFVGYFARTAHKPKVLSVTMFFSAIAGFLMASPYFLFPLNEDQQQPMNTSSLYQHQGDHNNELCRAKYSTGDVGQPSLLEGCDPSDDGVELSEKHKAWYIFLFAQLLNGVGGVGLQTLGLAYLDENASKAKCSLYIGIVTSMYAFGPVGGLLLSAVALRFPENPTQKTTLTPEDPMWIGCWWLGYALCSVCILVAIVPMWFFPKHMVPPASSLTVNNRRNLPQHKSKWQVILHHLKGFPKSLVSLFKNKAFMTMLLMVVCMSFILQGIFVQLVRFLEVHYMVPAFKASIITAITAAGAGAIGGFLGGIVMSVLHLTPRGAAWMLSIAMGVTTAGVGVVMFMGCPQIQMDGIWNPDSHRLQVTTPCNEPCGCPEGEGSFTPVCGANGLSYFTPCHAGCTSFINGTYSDCTCIVNQINSTMSSISTSPIPPSPIDATASPGLCSLECSLLIPFSIVIFIMCLMGSSARVPGTILQFRIVKPEEKSFALSLISFGMNILAMIPGPIMFGILIDKSCILWQQTCHGSGACLLFDTAKFRLNTYGVTFGFELLAFLLTLLLVYFVYKMDFPPEEEQIDELEVTVQAQTDKNDLTQESNA